MSRMVAIALNHDERDAVARLLIQALKRKNPPENAALLRDVAEMLLHALPADELEALRDG